MAALGDLVDFRKGRKPTELLDEQTEGSHAFYQIGELRGESTPRYAVDPTGTTVDKNDLCIVWDGANAGTVGYGLNGIIGSTITRLRPKDSSQIFSPYLGLFLQSKFTFLNGTAQGAAIPHIDGTRLRQLELVLPTINEQKRIASILNKANAIRQKRQKVIKLADEFLRSVFLDMFGDPAINSKQWPMGTIRELVVDAKYGSSSKAGSDGQFPILRMNNITYKGGWNFDDLKYINLNKKEQDKYLAHQGDILFNRTNSKELVGKTAVYREIKPIAFAGYLIRIRTNENANPEYISAYLNSKHGKTTLLNMCKSIVGMANINAQELQDIRIALPPRLLQDDFAKIVQRTLSHRSKHIKAKYEAFNLFNSLSQRAFRGEL